MTAGRGFGRRFATALMAAALGAYGGLLYAESEVPPGPRLDAVRGLYASAGAAFLVLGLRIGSLALEFFRDLRGD
jgi:hypothetical protein